MPRPGQTAAVIAILAGLPILAGAGTTPPSTPVPELEKLKSQAHLGVADAEYRLGVLYLKGEGGVEKDTAKAKLLLTNAAMQNHTEAAFELGNLIFHTYGAPAAEAIKWLTIAAEAGMVDAQQELGELYLFKSNIPSNAAPWFEAAIKQGDVRSKALLSYMLLEGKGTLRNEERGLKLLKEAAEAGYAESQNNMAKICFRSSDSASIAEGRRWLLKAAATGSPEAASGLAFMYWKGRYGFPVDKNESIRWYKKAAELGVPEAQCILGLAMTGFSKDLPPMPVDLEEAERWIRLSLANGNPNAPKSLEFLLKSKKYLNDIRAKAEQGDSESQNILATHYSQGSGVPRDQAKCVQWLSKSAASGNTKAKEALDILKANPDAEIDLESPPAKTGDQRSKPAATP